MFGKLAEGDIFKTTEACATSGPRTAVLKDGSVACTFMLNTKGGANDFVPMIAYSQDCVAWTEARQIWPELTGKKSTFVSIRSTLDGRYGLCGTQWDIDHPGEAFWSDEAGGMKENRLVCSISESGRDYPLPFGVELPYYAAAECPGGMLVHADGTFDIVYSPYPTIEGRLEADTHCMVLLRSRDGGRTFSARKFAQIDDPCLYAESWLTRLSDGRLFVSTWQTMSDDSNQFLISTDDGGTFAGPYSQPFRGQSTGICAGADGTVYIAYNQRKEQPAGVWLALERPDENGPNLLANEPVWKAGDITKNNSSGDFAQWTDFSFGEPHVNLLPDGTLLVVLWYQQGDCKGIRYVRLARE